MRQPRQRHYNSKAQTHAHYANKLRIFKISAQTHAHYGNKFRIFLVSAQTHAGNKLRIFSLSTNACTLRTIFRITGLAKSMYVRI